MYLSSWLEVENNEDRDGTMRRSTGGWRPHSFQGIKHYTQTGLNLISTMVNEAEIATVRANRRKQGSNGIIIYN